MSKSASATLVLSESSSADGRAGMSGPSLHFRRHVSTPASARGRRGSATRAHWGTWVCSTASAGARGPACARPPRRRPHGFDARARRRPRRRAAPRSDFVAARRGVEGFVEPRTAVSDVTLLLVAARRRVDPAPGALGATGRTVLQPAPGAVVRRRGGRHPAADARLQPPPEARGRAGPPCERQSVAPGPGQGPGQRRGRPRAKSTQGARPRSRCRPRSRGPRRRRS